ncbi:hypothetical protein LR48_Vigan11g029800 [Vigna angularis]|uniref:Ubiquitin-like protease family profile domain-containing protein n=1 Tax=Phaseolus angularis TaxID=3914 RepID=A0A0L9VQC0_PHAAN|nr:hypothetical protein LR48_Vigan11g029800 [Vigna angularis]
MCTREQLRSLFIVFPANVVAALLIFECNQQLDSWECGFYVMCWIKTIIRAVITDDWNKRFKSTLPISEDTIKQIRQEWTTYLLQGWS